jgi:hypothetical protein
MGMELQTVPVGGRSRAARLRTWAAILLPVVVLTGVVGGGVLGRSDADRAGAADREASIDGPTATPDATPRATPAAASPWAPVSVIPLAPAPPSGVVLPTEILGLAVHDVRDARGGPRRARPEELVAVAGWLTVAPADPRCEATWYLVCRQTGFISTDRGLGGPSLSIETQRGVPLIGLTRQSPSPGTWSVPSQAIVIGRFTSPLFRECGLQIPECEPVLTVERLAWIRRTERERPLAFGPGSVGSTWPAERAEAAGRDALSDATAGRLGDTLLLARFDHATLALIDPLAADAAAASGPADPLWYLRTIVWRDTPRGSEPGVGWAVLDDTTRGLLGSG